MNHGTRYILPAAHRIKNLAVEMQGEESGRADLGGQPDRRELPVVRVESGMVDDLGPAATPPEEDVERLGRTNAEKSESQGREKEAS